MKKYLVIYERGQIPFLDELRKKYPAHSVVACGLDIEFALEEKGIPFDSARRLRITPAAERLEWARTTADAVCNEALNIEYRGVKLSELFVVMMQDYLSKLSYWIDCATELVRDGDEVVVPSTTHTVAPAGRELDRFELDAPAKAFELACAEHRATYIREELPKPPTRPQMHAFWTEALFAILNIFIKLTSRPRQVRIVASEYWRNISPLMGALPQGELFLLDRSEIKNMQWRDMLRHRVRFIHPESFLSSSARASAHEAARDFKAGAPSAVVCKSILLDKTIHEAVAHIILRGGPRAALVIEGAYAMFQKIKPDCIVVRASTSAQIHFAALCRAGQVLGIPSVELQHGILYLGPGSYSRRPTASYIAEYGPIAAQGLREAGYTGGLLNVGSPRFDVYQTQRAPVSKRVVCVSPELSVGLWMDTYDIFDYYRALGEGIESAGLEMVVKLRPGPRDNEFYRAALSRVCKTYEIRQSEPMHKVFENAYAIVSCYSTVIVEALLSGIPLIYGGLVPLHDAFGKEFKAYESQGALLYASGAAALGDALRRLDNKEFRARITGAAADFMQKNYSFGNAAQKLAGDIARIVKKPV